MQITVTDKNEWEGESFSFILEVTPEVLAQIKEGIKDYIDGELTLQENTEYTQEFVEKKNRMAYGLGYNRYMDRYGFYEFDRDLSNVVNWYEDVFYKAVGLKRLV
jgi:hypothetical protein